MLKNSQKSVTIQVYQGTDGSICHHVSIGNLKYTAKEIALIKEAVRNLYRILSTCELNPEDIPID